jgi:hypothetical protein
MPWLLATRLSMLVCMNLTAKFAGTVSLMSYLFDYYLCQKLCQLLFFSSLEASKVLLCYQNQYIIYCGFPAGWYICEDIRSGVANLCPNLKCYVLSASADEPQAHLDAEIEHRTQGLGFGTHQLINLCLMLLYFS